MRDAERLLSALMSPAAAAGYQVEVRPVPGPTSFYVGAGVPELPEVLGPVNWFFGVCPRRSDNHEVDVATTVWCDVDHVPNGWLEAGVVDQIHPRPSAVVNTGRGVHIYWFLETQVAAGEAVRLSRLATLAYKGDMACCEPRRVLRLPGTFNYKYSPARSVTLAHLEGKGKYNPTALENALFAAIVAPFWAEGNRHGLALAVGAVLARASWDENRVRDTIKIICQLCRDTEVRDRVTAAVDTLVRKDAGIRVSAELLRDALGKQWSTLMLALGITSRNGDLMLDGVLVGRQETIERDIAKMITSTGDWAIAEGTISKWDGTRWRESSNTELISQIFHQLSDLQVVKQGDLVQMAPKVPTAGAIATVVTGNLLAQPLAEPDPNFLPLENGVLDLSTYKVLAHDKEYRNRWTLPVTYDPGSSCPGWIKFLAEMAPSEAEYLQEWVGYMLWPRNPWQVLLWLYGPTGTGKSTFLSVVSGLFGPAGVAISTDRLNDYTVATVASKLVAVCSEIPSTVLRTTTLKALVAGDEVAARFPYGRPFSVEFGGKIVWSSNALPSVDQSEGLWRRIKVVQFNQIPVKRNPLLGEHLRTELPGILNWAIEGLKVNRKRLQTRSDWEAPASVNAVVTEYRESADTFQQFLEEEIHMDEKEATELSVDIYRRYSYWAKERGFMPIPFGPGFWRELRRGGLSPITKRINGNLARMWVGGRLRPEDFR